MKVVTEEMRRKAMEYGWSSEQVKKGYAIFSRNKVGNGATHIQRIDSLMKFDNDDEAAKYAEEVDGVKLIHAFHIMVVLFPEKWDTERIRERQAARRDGRGGKRRVPDGRPALRKVPCP